MTREEAKQLFRDDKNSYGQTRAPMTKLDAIFDSIESQHCSNCVHLQGLVQLSNDVYTAPYCGFHILSFYSGTSPMITPDIGQVDYKVASCYRWKGKTNNEKIK